MKRNGKNQYCWVSLFLLLTLLPGCEMFQRDKSENPEKKEEDRFAFLHRDEKEAAAGAMEQKPESDEVKVKQTEKSAVSDSDLKKLESHPSVPRDGKETADPSKRTPFYEDFLLLDDGEQTAVSLVFNSAPLIDVIPAFADILGFNFLADPDLKSTVTLNINSNMTKRELWVTFERMLRMAGASIRCEGSLLRIVPVSKLAQQPDLSLDEKAREIFCYPLKNTTAKDMAAQIKPFLGKDAAIAELAKPNAILICDTAENTEKLKQILDLADRSGKSSWPRLVMKCENVLPSRIVAELKEVFPVLGFYVVQSTDARSNTEQPGSVQLTAVDRIQLIVGSAATHEAIEEIRNWVTILDSAPSLDQERVFVYKVLHGNADRLLSGLSMIYNTTGQSLTIDNSTGNVRTTTVNTQSTSGNSTRRTNSGSSIQTGTNGTTASTQTDQASSIFETPVRIFADGELNRLVIRTTPRTYASIKAVLDRLDVVPAQVLLQVLVVEVTLDKSTEFGLELSMQGTIDGNVIGGGTDYSNLNPFTVTKDSSGNITSVLPNAENGGRALIYNPDNPTQKYGYVKALAKNGNVKVISSPQVLVSSHKEAEIWVGERVPYIASAMTDTASQSRTSTVYNTTVSFEDVGIRMTITPEVTSSEYIALDVNQELSGVDETGKTYSSSVNCPIFWKRTVETNMTIRNGHTMVIGGLIQEKRSDALSSVPLIANIPLLRRLFGSTDASAQRSEILILITGTVVTEKNQVEDMIRKYNDALRYLNAFDRTLGDQPDANKPFTVFEEGDVSR